MKDFFKPKTWLITVLMLFVAVSISFMAVFYEYRQDTGVARADSSHNISGYAWSENFGWVSFNCTNDSSCATSNYGVNIDQDTGNFSGYAWSANAGWIDFGPTSGYPEAPNTPAHYDSATGVVTGWAKVLSLGDDGWLKMSGTWSNGVNIASASGYFSGYAWNGNSDDSGIGWVSFNCSNDSSCGVSDYKVVGDLVPPAPTDLTTDPLSCSTMRLDWTDNSSNETGFETQWSADGVSDWTSHSPDLNPDINYRSVVQSPATTLYYRVRALGSSGNSDWEPGSGGVVGTTSYCAPTNLQVESFNCDNVQLTWEQLGTGVDHYDMQRNKDGEGWVTIEGDIPSAQLNYTDSDIVSGSSYQYLVVAQTAGLESDSVSVTPCPDVPSWQEVKPD